MLDKKWLIGFLMVLTCLHPLFGQITITHGPVLGRPGATSMGIWARTSVAGSFQVRYGIDPEKLDMISDPVLTSSRKDNTGWTLLTGLKSRTTYHYSVFTNDDDGREDLSGSFRTLASASEYKNDDVNPEGLFNFAFEFACGNQDKPDKDPVYKMMLEKLKADLDFAILNGDWLYERKRGYKVEEWLTQVNLSKRKKPDVVNIMPHIAGAWENYKFYTDLSEPLQAWHRNIPSFYTYDDHEILDDSRGAGKIGHRDRIAVYRDIGVQAWYDYLGWSNPVIFEQPIHYGTGKFKKNSDILFNKKADFTALDLSEASNLHVHWADDYAWRHLKRYDGKGGVANAGVYGIKEVVSKHMLRITPPARESAANAYSIGRLSYFNWKQANCEFFFVDTRGHREMPITIQPDKPGQSILGKQQKAWLKEHMRNSSADFLIVVSSVNLLIPHIVDAGEGDDPDSWPGKQEDSWSGFPKERSEMLAFWNSLGKPVLVLTGDLHNSFVAKSGDNVWEFASGPHSSGNARAKGEGNRPPNGEWEWRNEKFDIRWSTFMENDDSYNQKVYCVVQVNNVLANDNEEGGKTWIAYPQPSITVQYYDGLTGKLLYAESVLANREKSGQ